MREKRNSNNRLSVRVVCLGPLHVEPKREGSKKKKKEVSGITMPDIKANLQHISAGDVD